MSLDQKQLRKVGLAGGALAAAVAAAYYGYDQCTKRYPVYKEQCALFKEVWWKLKQGGYRASAPFFNRRSTQCKYVLYLSHVRMCSERPTASSGRGASQTLFRNGNQVHPPIQTRCTVLTQYEAAMLPPRSEMQALEDDILKQVSHQQLQLQKWLQACCCKAHADSSSQRSSTTDNQVCILADANRHGQGKRQRHSDAAHLRGEAANGVSLAKRLAGTCSTGGYRAMRSCTVQSHLDIATHSCADV